MRPMKIRLDEITRHRDEVLPLGDIQGDWLIIPDARRKDYEATFRRIRGLGDLVEVFAKPIAKAIDSVAGSNLSECGGCAKRRDALNRVKF